MIGRSSSLRNKKWFCAKFISQHKAESTFRKVVREGRKWAKEKGNTENNIPPNEGARIFALTVDAYQ